MNSVKSTHQKIKRNIRLLILVSFLALVGVGGYLFQIRQHPAFQEALFAIEASEELSIVTGQIKKIGLVPSHNLRESSAEYWIDVYSVRGKEGDRKVWIYLEQNGSEDWTVDHFSIEFMSQRSGNEVIFVVLLIAGLLFAFSLTITVFKYVGRVRFLSAASFRQVTGRVEEVVSRLEKTTMPGQSNLGVLKTDFEERSVTRRESMYKVQVIFQTETGEEIILGNDFSSNKKYKPGDAIEVLYHQDDPEKAELMHFFWFWPQFWFVFTIVFFVFVCGSSLLALTI